MDTIVDATAPAGRSARTLTYNAKGQREKIDYGNGASTAYEYDPLTFRLSSLKTTRPANADATASQLFKDPSVVQDLRYSYDPVGNITRIEDVALKTIVHAGQNVEPVGSYIYDAVYRLIEAKGREHIGQNAFDFHPPNGDHRDYPFVGRAHPNDLQALRNYTERYEYDPVGNFVEYAHRFNSVGWTRRYEYQENSLLEAGKKGNRLTKTTVGNGINRFEPYAHDSHGNMTSMPHLAAMVWDFKDQFLQADLGSGGNAYYVYDGAGQRVRKVIESQNGVRQKERMYLGGFEIYREYNGAGISFERESLHVLDDKQRVALVETQTVQNGNAVNSPVPLQRYQFGNHLSSSSVELDKHGALIAYEEYHPYGTTSFQVGRSAAEVSLKRYRYSGKECDEESGLSYHGSRYYATWLGRWTACDPAGFVDGSNVYVYVRNRPLVFTDPSGQWSWGKVLGIAAAVVVGVAVTALTGGIAGPIAAGIIGGMAAGAAGEIVEAAVDNRPITLRNVAISAVIGGVAGGVFAGAGQLIANTGVGRALAARVASSAVGQAVSRAAYRVATSEARAAVAARAGGAAVRRGVTALEEAGEAAGRRMGGPFARNAAAQAERRSGLAAAQADADARATSGVQATLQGEVNGQPVNVTTRSGVDRSGTGLNAIETPAGRVQAPSVPGPLPLPPPLEPLPVQGASGNTFVRGADAEIKLFGHTLLSTPADATGRLYLGVTAPMCPSCSANLWQTRAAVPGLQIISDMPSPAAGAAGALDRVVPRQSTELPPSVPTLQLQVNF